MKHCRELSDTAFTSFYILNRYNYALYQSSQDDLYKNCYDKLNKIKTTSGKFHERGGIFFYQSIPSTNCTLIAYTPYTQLLSNATFIIGIITLLYLLSPILYMTFLAPLIQHQLAPLKKLSDAMSGYSVGNDIDTDIHTDDEIEVVNDSFHQMIKEINRQIINIKKKEHENSVVSYKLLATQIDPHFIYNTMNIINILARDGNMDAVVEINSALIKILRERLNAKLNVFESIDNEVDTMMQYCLIASYRYQNHIKVHFNIDDALDNKLIPKNILQPLVENAFFHGFPDESSIIDGSVGILIYSMKDEIIIEVSDNGQGMTQERINELLNNSYSIYEDKKPHIGIDNIKQRLSYLYNGNYQLVIQSAINQGTTVIITIPDTSA
jgi:sensor histidine kinase YesM